MKLTKNRKFCKFCKIRKPALAGGISIKSLDVSVFYWACLNINDELVLLHGSLVVWFWWVNCHVHIDSCIKNARHIKLITSYVSGSNGRTKNVELHVRKLGCCYKKGYTSWLISGSFKCGQCMVHTTTALGYIDLFLTKGKINIEKELFGDSIQFLCSRQPQAKLNFVLCKMSMIGHKIINNYWMRFLWYPE